MAFSSVFGRRASNRIAARQPIPGDIPILVRRSVFVDTDDKKIVSALIDEYVNPLLNRGYYIRGELPANAMRSYHTDFYLAQVANGGHGQFMHNSQMNSLILGDIREGLAAIGIEPYISIFRDFEKFVSRDPKRAAEVASRRGFGEPDAVVASLDQRFFDGDCYKTLMPANGRWLKRLPELKVVPDAEFASGIDALIAANPQREPRAAISKEARLNADLENPLLVAGRLLCLKTNCMPIVKIGHGDPSTIAPNGEQVTGWYLLTAKGRRCLQIGSETTYLCETYLKDGTKLTDELMDSAWKNVSSLNIDGIDRFSKLTHREVASIPTRHVESAIDAAKKLPVVLIARMLTQELGNAEPLQYVYAGFLHESGQWLWIAETEKRAAIFGQSGDDFVLSDLNLSNKLASVSIDDIRIAMSRQQASRA